LIQTRRGTAIAAVALSLGFLAGAGQTATASPADPGPAAADTRGLFGSGDPTYDGVYRQSAAIMGLAAAGADVPPSAVAWLLRHPAKMQPILGTTQPQRVREIAQAAQVEMTREEWYRLYLAAGNKLP